MHRSSIRPGLVELRALHRSASALMPARWTQVAPPADPDKAAAWASHESLLLRMEVKDQAVARELAGLGLPLSMHPGDTPDPPFDTPFSGVVYFLAKLTRGWASLHAPLLAFSSGGRTHNHRGEHYE